MCSFCEFVNRTWQESFRAIYCLPSGLSLLVSEWFLDGDKYTFDERYFISKKNPVLPERDFF